VLAPVMPRRLHDRALRWLVRAAAPLLLLLLTAGMLQRAPGLGSVAVAALATLVATGMPWLLAWLGWTGLSTHVDVLAQREKARRACACACELASKLRHHVAVAMRRIIIHVALIIIGNRALPTHCISPRVVAQRPI